MKPYVKVYLQYFGYTTADFMVCEIPECGKRAVDVMHIYPKSIYDSLRNDIKNLMGGCREHHDKYAVGEENQEWLQKVHLEFMEKHGVDRSAKYEKRAKQPRKKLYNVFK